MTVVNYTNHNLKMDVHDYIELSSTSFIIEIYRVTRIYSMNTFLNLFDYYRDNQQ